MNHFAPYEYTDSNLAIIQTKFISQLSSESVDGEKEGDRRTVQ